jgi:riboflavin kinase/FMN adenylyltransferase
MKIIFGIGGIKRPIVNCVLAIGVFDGVHRGHQALIARALAKAEKIGGKLYVMTFSPHPMSVLHPEENHKNIITLEHRLSLIARTGAAGCIVVPFTKRFAGLSPAHFVKNYLAGRIHPIDVFVGSDFRFGHDREGNLKLFSDLGKEYGFNLDIVHCVESEHLKISSTSIRQYVQDGELKKAAKLLGRNFSVLFKVSRGAGRGRKLGFPTINFYPKGIVLPPFGVYATRTHVGENIFDSVTYVGIRPMFESKGRVGVETFIFDFEKMIYGKEVLVEFIKWIRPEKIFPSQEAFILQMDKDKMKARKILSALKSA